MSLREVSRRLFFALWPDAGQQEALAQSARQAIQASGGRPIPAGNLHLTVAFLGAVPERRIPELATLARRVVAAAPLQFSFTRLEYWARPQVLCAVPEATPVAAMALADSLRTELVAAGFTPDLKLFRAHVTLARKVQLGSHALNMTCVSWSFTELALVESQTAAQGALYSVLDSWLLVKPQLM